MKIIPSKIAFLIRAYNEASRIWWVIEGIKKAGYNNILVINDGSKDDTANIVWKYDTWYVEHPQNRGGWAALETGFEFFRRNAEELWVEYIVTFDADGQHAIADMPKFITAFEKDPSLDVVLGSRFIVKTKTNVPFFRKLVLMGGKIFTWAISGIRLTDSHNGYRMFRIRAIQNIVLSMDGMEYASELIEQIHILSLKYQEVPVNIHYDEYTLAKWQRYGGVWRIASRMLWWKYFR